MRKLSVIIITFNEAQNIARCLDSLDFADEIIVVDSYSSDKTPQIANRKNVRFVQHPWCGYSKQKQYALSLTRNNWVLWIDADEEVPPALKDEILALETGETNGYYLPRKVFYLGRWIRHCGWYPGYVLRLFDKRKGQFNDKIVHEGFDSEGKTGRLKNPLLHYSYRNIRHHIEKMNSLSDLSSGLMYTAGKKTGMCRAALHAMMKFLKMYLLRLGILDGRAGFIVCVLGSYYVFLKYAKLWEKHQIRASTKEETG